MTRIIDISKLLEDLQKIADLAIYNCDPAGPGRVTVSEKIIDYFQSDDFAVIGMLQRGEARLDDVDALNRTLQAQDAEMRELRQKIVKLEEVEGINRSLLLQNGRLLERIADLKVDCQ